MQKTSLYIHIGTWKTGSSTIQYNLNKYRDELEKEGFVYLSKENKMVTDDGIIRNFREVNPAYVAGSRKKFSRILDEKRKKTVILYLFRAPRSLAATRLTALRTPPPLLKPSGK